MTTPQNTMVLRGMSPNPQRLMPLPNHIIEIASGPSGPVHSTFVDPGPSSQGPCAVTAGPKGLLGRAAASGSTEGPRRRSLLRRAVRPCRPRVESITLLWEDIEGGAMSDVQQSG